MDTENPQRNRTESQPAVCHALQLAAALLALTTLVGLLLMIGELANRPESGGAIPRLVAPLAWLAGGAGGTGLLMALSAVVRRLSAANRALARIERQMEAAGRGAALMPGAAPQGAAAAPAGIDPATFERLERLLADIRDNVLLTDEERRARRAQLIELEKRERVAQIEQAITAGQYYRARQLLGELQRRLGADETSRELADRIELAAERAEAEDVAVATRQCEDLMSLTSWDQAIKVATDLVERHPQSQAARQLAARVQREKQVHQQEHRNRLFVEVQQHTSNRAWQKALDAARQLVQAYPDSAEAASLRPQLETLQTNAEIEHRRELEAEYKRLCEARQFGDALALAREVVARYPQSPQARVMREQIPVLEKQARAHAG